jgi:heavy metal efflux system protein
VLIGEAQFDLVLRYQKQYRDTKEAIENVRLLSPSGERVSLAQLTKIEHRRRRGGDLSRGRTALYRRQVQRARPRSWRHRRGSDRKVNKQVPLPKGYHYVWAGEYESKQRADKRLAIIVPLTILLIFIILYMMFKSFKWAGLILVNVALARVGGSLALLVTHTNISVSSSVGIPRAVRRLGADRRHHAGVHQPVARRGHTIEGAAIEGAVLRLRPIMMTMLVATLGLLPAATFSHGIGSDSQRPFAIVIVGGLISDLVMSIFLLPTLYVWINSDMGQSGWIASYSQGSGLGVTGKDRIDVPSKIYRDPTSVWLSVHSIATAVELERNSGFTSHGRIMEVGHG